MGSRQETAEKLIVRRREQAALPAKHAGGSQDDVTGRMAADHSLVVNLKLLGLIRATLNDEVSHR